MASDTSHNLVDLYTNVLGRLGQLLQEGLSSEAGELPLLNVVNGTWLKVRTWGHDIDQENTNVLGNLGELAKPLAEEVLAHLVVIRTALSHVEKGLGGKDKWEDVDQPKRLVESMADAATKLARLAEPIMNIEDDRSDSDLRILVQQILGRKKAIKEPSLMSPDPTQTSVKTALRKASAGDLLASLSTTQEIIKPRIDLHRLSVAIRELAKSKPFKPISKDEVRLGTISPGSRYAPLQCSIFTIRVDELSQYKYEALSYAWPEDFNASTRTTVLVRNENLTQINDPKISQQFSHPLDHREAKIVQSFEYESKLSILEDLSDALRALRNEDRKVIFWADAICLDLADEEEKRIQSANFSEIFFQANSVTHWLGNDEPEIEEQFDAVEHILSIFGQESVEPVQKSLSQKKNPRTRKEEKDLNLSYSKLLELMHNRSFSRRWVVQELILARKVTLHCGRRTLAWNELVEAMTSWASRKTKRPEVAEDIYFQANVKPEKSPPIQLIATLTEEMPRKDSTGQITLSHYSLHDLVLTFSRLDSASHHPRDAVCAFLSLAKDVVHFSPLKDNTTRASQPARDVHIAEAWNGFSQLSTLDVFVKFVQHCTDSLGKLDIICRPWAPLDSGQLPSWIRKIKHQNSPDPTVIPFATDSQTYRAADSTKPVCRFGASAESDKLEFSRSTFSEPVQRDQGRIRARFYDIVMEVMRLYKRFKQQRLYAKGILLGRVEELSTRIISGVVPRECMELGGLNFFDQNRWKPEDIPPMLWRTLVAGRAPTGLIAPGIYRRLLAYCMNNSPNGDLYADIRNMQELAGRDTASDKLQLDNERTNSLEEFLNLIRNVTHNRKLFRARNDELLGLAPADAAVGDVVCILFGCSVPVILRERLTEDLQGSPHYYELIGECYVDGVMDGEAIHELGKEELKAQTVEFEIR